MHLLAYLIFVIFSANFVINASLIQCNRYKLKNGRVRMKVNSKLVRFACFKGYTLLGIKYTGCLKGYFEQEPPICVNNKPNCNQITGLNNGFVVPETNKVVVHFFCKPEYQLIGSNTTICDGSTWTNQLPHCLSNNKTEPDTSCGFEREDLCGWSHDLNHNFDWKRTNFTRGAGKNGYYMFVESTTRRENDSSRLISPIFPKYPQLCARFYYHMFGVDMGTLNVYIKQEGDLLEGLEPLFSVTGNQGDAWHLGEVSLENGTLGAFQVIFEGIKGKSFLSDVAIDDVSIINETCPQLSASETPETSLSTDSSTDYPYFESCLGHCGEYSDSQSCSCLDSCFDLNTCCPDYIQSCLLGSSVDYEDVEVSTIDSSTFSTYISSSTIIPTSGTSETSETSEAAEIFETTLEVPKVPVITETTETTTELPAITLFEIETDFLGKTEYLQQNTVKPEIKTSHFFVYVGLGGATVFVIVSAVLLVIIKRNRLNCGRFNGSRNNDSMSDVRFLASDEVLDFTWQRAGSLET